MNFWKSQGKTLLFRFFFELAFINDLEIDPILETSKPKLGMK
jgi:hypothetical protein